MAPNYDAILIGSGMGSLTVASLLATLRGKRVLVVERHFKPGGFTHAFQRGRFHWDVGLHYVGQMGEGTPTRRLFDLITGGAVRWTKMPDPFETFVYPGLEFAVRSGVERYTADLIERFPEEERAIRNYFGDLRRAAAAWGMSLTARAGGMVGAASRCGMWFRKPDFELTTGTYLDAHFRSPALKALLSSQWGDYGLPPSQSPFGLHALIATHYFDGGYYPVGGAGAIASGAQQRIEAAGGRILVNRTVTEIVIDGGRAVGVRTQKTQPDHGGQFEEFRAPVVISGAGAAATYLRMIPASYPVPFRDSLRRFVTDCEPPSCVTLYVGFRRDPRDLGFRGGNVWIYSSFDHDDLAARARSARERFEPGMAYLSFPSLKDPRAQAHTAEIITMASYATFARWANQPWLRRDTDYRSLKQSISGALLDFVEQRFPGFKERVEYCELSTPLSNESMTGHVKGSIYGLPVAPERFLPENAGWTSPRSPLPGLFLTGADVSSAGIMGAIIGGLITLSVIPGGVGIGQAFRAALSGNHSYRAPIEPRRAKVA